MRALTHPDDQQAWRRWAFDAGLAGLLLALSLSLFSQFLSRGTIDNVPLAVALLVIHSGVVAWRRRAPVAVLALNLASAVAFALLAPTVALGVALLVALYTVALRCQRRTSVPALVLVTAIMAVTLAITTRLDASTIVGNAVILGVVWFLGESGRARRAYVEQLKERTAELERARDELAKTAVESERLRIARELHDILAHNMGMIAVQAGVGAHVIDERPADAKRSLEAIEEASKSSLAEIRQMLGLLRSNGEQAVTNSSPRLSELQRLANDITAAGLPIELRIEDTPDDLPPALELTIYRVVQEALTNSLRHAGASKARAAVWFDDGSAHVEVVDDGTSEAGGASDGHGLIGMNERVSMHGGSLETGSLPEGGYRVTATIPLEGGAP